MTVETSPSVPGMLMFPQIIQFLHVAPLSPSFSYSRGFFFDCGVGLTTLHS